MMKIAITAEGQDLESRLDERFGRCRYFLLTDPETEQYEVVENLGDGTSGGAGVSAAQLIVDHGAEALITGHIGPNAIRALQATNVKVYLTPSCLVREALGKFKSNELESALEATVQPHFGNSGR